MATATFIKTANNSLDDTLEGLDLGADDYLTMVHGLAEMKYRIKAVLKRVTLGVDETDTENNLPLEAKLLAGVYQRLALFFECDTNLKIAFKVKGTFFKFGRTKGFHLGF